MATSSYFIAKNGVCTPVTCATTCTQSPIVCGSTCVVGTITCGTSCVISPVVCSSGGNVSTNCCVVGAITCGTSCVTTPYITATCHNGACMCSTGWVQSPCFCGPASTAGCATNACCATCTGCLAGVATLTGSITNPVLSSSGGNVYVASCGYYMCFGPLNASFSHFNTNTPAFYFYCPICSPTYIQATCFCSGATFASCTCGNAASATCAITACLLGGPACTNGTDGWFRSSGCAGWYNSSFSTGIWSGAAGAVCTYNNSTFCALGGNLQTNCCVLSASMTCAGTCLYSPTLCLNGGLMCLYNANLYEQCCILSNGMVCTAACFQGGCLCITSIPSYGNSITATGYSGAIQLADVTVNCGFTPGFHMSSTISGVGYRMHASMGIFRECAGAWNGGMYFGLGGNDAYPTEYFTLCRGGSIIHSSGNARFIGCADCSNWSNYAVFACCVCCNPYNASNGPYPIAWFSGNQLYTTTSICVYPNACGMYVAGCIWTGGWLGSGGWVCGASGLCTAGYICACSCIIACGYLYTSNWGCAASGWCAPGVVVSGVNYAVYAQNCLITNGYVCAGSCVRAVNHVFADSVCRYTGGNGNTGAMTNVDFLFLDSSITSLGVCFPQGAQNGQVFTIGTWSNVSGLSVLGGTVQGFSSTINNTDKINRWFYYSGTGVWVRG